MVEFVKARRIKPNPRDEFILILRLIVIIGHSILWGLKTPAICFVLQVFKEDDDVLSAVYWIIKMVRAFWLFYNTCINVYILFSLLVIIAITGAWLSGCCAVQGPLGPGFDSQVPHNFYIVLLNIFMCSACQGVYRAYQIPRRQVAINVHPMVKKWRTPYSPVNACTLDSRSQQA